MASRKRDIRKLIERIVREMFDDARILSVDVAEDVDSDGDPILRVRVVFETESGKLDASKTSGIIRHLRPRLSEAGVAGFPLMYFISKKDAEGFSTEAA